MGKYSVRRLGSLLDVKKLSEENVIMEFDSMSHSDQKIVDAQDDHDSQGLRLLKLESGK